MFSRLRRLFKAAGREVVVLWHVCRNPETPFLIKAGALLLAIYVISPIDLIADPIPLIGWIDDVTLLAFGIPALLKLTPVATLKPAQEKAERVLSRWRFWRI